jgi:hypothetical protein
MRVLSSFLLGAALVGAAASGVAAPRHSNVNEKAEAKLATALAGRTPGKPVSCINLRDIQSSEIFDGTAILYRVNGGQVYLQRPKIGRESLDDDSILVSKTYGSQLCNLDTINLIDRGSRIQRGFVALDDFVPYSKPAKG